MLSPTMFKLKLILESDILLIAVEPVELSTELKLKSSAKRVANTVFKF